MPREECRRVVLHLPSERRDLQLCSGGHGCCLKLEGRLSLEVLICDCRSWCSLTTINSLLLAGDWVRVAPKDSRRFCGNYTSVSGYQPVTLPLPLPLAFGTVDKLLKSVTHVQCHARPTLTFPAVRHHFRLTGTISEAHVCEQLAKGCYLTAERPGVEPVTFRVTSPYITILNLLDHRM